MPKILSLKASSKFDSKDLKYKIRTKAFIDQKWSDLLILLHTKTSHLF